MHNIIVFSFRMMSYIHSDLIWPLKSSRTVNYIFDISHSALISLDKSGFSLNFRCLKRKVFFEILKHLLWQNIHNWFHFQQKILLVTRIVGLNIFFKKTKWVHFKRFFVEFWVAPNKTKESGCFLSTTCVHKQLGQHAI